MREQVRSLRDSLVNTWQTFKTASWLGWQIESNWTDPVVFFILAIMRPLGLSLMLVLMYEVVAGVEKGPMFHYLYWSNAFFILVTQTLAGMSWAIFEDRENYRMLKYIYTSPANHFTFLMGRAVAKVGFGILTAVLLAVVGVAFLGLRFDFSEVRWIWLIVSGILGMAILVSIGLAIAGTALVMARNGEFVGEILSAAILLVTGAYFPPDVLPSGLREFSMALPITYWLEAMRRGIAGGIIATEDGTPLSPMLASISDVQLFWLLLGFAVILSFVSYRYYVWIEHQAKERGMIDRVTGY